MTLFIPSPSISYFQIGPLTIHIYALCLIAGIIAAWAIGNRRWQARGGSGESFETILLWAIPIGIVGARVYHVLTHLGDYFGPGISPWSVFAIWEGGIAIYGAIGFGTLAAWLVARRRKVAFPAFADSLAPGIAIGQAIGRFGNWFNQELYGLPTEVPWALEIDPAHRARGYESYATFHPTFLYESIWNVFVAGVLIWCDRRFQLGRGKVFALYIALYGLGRSFTESIRLDYSYDVFGPLRFNAAMAIVICLSGVALFLWLLKFRPGRESVVEFGADAGGRRLAEPVEAASQDAAEQVAAVAGTAKAAADGAADELVDELPEVERAPETEAGVPEAERSESSEDLDPGQEDLTDAIPGSEPNPVAPALPDPESLGSENTDLVGASEVLAVGADELGSNQPPPAPPETTETELGAEDDSSASADAPDRAEPKQF